MRSLMRKAVITPGREQSYAEFHFAAAFNADNTLHVSGHIGRGPNGIDPDPATQFRAAFSSVAETLAAAGASWADVVEMTSYHVGLQEHFDTFRRVRDEFVVEPYPAWTAVGVVELVASGAIVEIAATAILDPE
jgi:enamine deaminase RidA (YjgF/YER057c/UK114 family)